MKKKFMPSIALTSICLVVALLLAAVNTVTGPIIKAAADNKANETLLIVLPDGESFEEIDLSTVTLPAVVTKAYKETTGKGFVFEMTVSGYQSGLVVMCGIDAEGKVVASKYTASKETYGKENDLDGAYNGQTLDGFAPQIISGATKTSNGYASAIEAALQAYVIMSGGSVDLRDPAQILNDNCNAALGTEGKTFEKWFAVEVLEGVDGLYISEGTEGAVAKIGDIFVGIGADGKAIATDGVDADMSAKAEAAYEIYSASQITEITLPEGASKNVLGAWTTASGNYVIEVQAAGYGINGDEYAASGEYLKIKVALTADGKIISTLTVYQNESIGYGDACADPEYYERFNGTTVDNYKEVENISGSTITSNGYKKGIELVFKTLELIKGGAAE